MRRIPHKTILLTTLAVLLIAATLVMTHASLATIIPLSAILAAIPMSLAFGLQTVLQGIVAGRTIQAERKLSVGDTLVINNCEGVVIDIGLRATDLRNDEGSLVVVPNQVILTSVFTVKKGK